MNGQDFCGPTWYPFLVEVVRIAVECLIGDRYAEHEDIRVLVLRFPVDAELVVTCRVVDLKVHGNPVYSFDPCIDIKNSWLVVVFISIVQEARNEACLAS